MPHPVDEETIQGEETIWGNTVYTGPVEASAQGGHLINQHFRENEELDLFYKYSKFLRNQLFSLFNFWTPVSIYLEILFITKNRLHVYLFIFKPFFLSCTFTWEYWHGYICSTCLHPHFIIFHWLWILSNFGIMKFLVRRKLFTMAMLSTI